MLLFIWQISLWVLITELISRHHLRVRPGLASLQEMSRGGPAVTQFWSETVRLGTRSSLPSSTLVSSRWMPGSCKETAGCGNCLWSHSLPLYRTPECQTRPSAFLTTRLWPFGQELQLAQSSQAPSRISRQLPLLSGYQSWSCRNPRFLFECLGCAPSLVKGDPRSHR